MRRLSRLLPFLALAACTAAPPAPNVIEIEIDDHGLLGLWQANAPNLKGLIARGTYGYARVQVPTHSMQGNYSTVTGQNPDGNGVPANSPLDRPGLSQNGILAAFGVGDYAFYNLNPLYTRGDSIYSAARRIGAKSVYIGELPPLEAGADEVHFTLLDGTLDGIFLDADSIDGLLTGILSYPQSVVDHIHLDGPPDAATNETLQHFTFRDAANYIQATSAADMPRLMYVWDFIALDNNPTNSLGAEIPTVIQDYDDALGDMLDALDSKGLLDNTNIVFTLDHGKTDTHNQAVFGTAGGTASAGGDGQFGALVDSQGPALGVTSQDYVLENEDGDAMIYAKVPNAGSAAGAGVQVSVAHALTQLIQTGGLPGVDTTRTVTFDGYLGTRRMHDFRNEGPGQADVLAFPLPDWTLNQVDTDNFVPGPFREHTKHPYGRHGGFSTEELYVPLIMAGPAFKEGVMLPYPVNQSDVACTAMWALGAGYMTTAEGAPILAALKGQPGETIPQTIDMSGSATTILAAGGYGTSFSNSSGPASSAVVIDVAGLYYEELFSDQTPALRQAAQPLLALAQQGTVFDHFWNRYRDWPVNEFEMLTGGYPVQDDFIPFAEDDPAQTAPPGFGLLAMPVPAGFVSDPAGLSAWRQTQYFGTSNVFVAAQAAGLNTALVGQLDYHAIHIDTSEMDLSETLDPASIPGVIAAFEQDHPRSLLYVALGGPRTSDRHSAAAVAELGALSQQVAGIANALPNALVLITSRGATALDDPSPDFYGVGTSRHVPLIAVGPNVRAGVVTSEPGQSADIPATALVGLGLPTRTDFVDGTWAAGKAVGGVPEPSPAGATGGHALVRMFTTSGP